MGTRIKHGKRTRVIPVKNRRCKAMNITHVLPTGAWKGKTCYLIGGGPSLKSFDFSCIKNELTIGVNKAFIQFPTTINYAMDKRFYDMVTFAQRPEWKKLHEQWEAYKGIKLFVKQGVRYRYDESVYVVNWIQRKMLSFELAKGIHGGNNSGYGAIALAIALGAKRIGLLGYDLKIKKKTKDVKPGKDVDTHWHEGYVFQSKRAYQPKLNKFRMCFEEFAPIIAERGIEVVNLNPDSALKCFPMEDIKTFKKKSGKG